MKRRGLESAEALMRELGIRVEQRKVGRKLRRVLVHPPWWTRESRRDAIEELIERCVPRGERRLFSVERLAISSATSEPKEDVSIIFKRTVVGIGIRDVPRGKRKVRRRPIVLGIEHHEPQTERASGLVVFDYKDKAQSEKAVTERKMILLPDGKQTDNTGWERLERPGKTPNFKKFVDGKSYIIDSWKAMAARVEGSLNADVPAIRPAPTRTFGSEPRIPRVMRTDTAPPKQAPKKTGGITTGEKLAAEFTRLTEQKQAPKAEPEAKAKPVSKKAPAKAKAPTKRKGGK